MYFQALDDKEECIGLYFDGKLVFEEEHFPNIMSGYKTWKYSGSLKETDIKFLWFYNEGKNLLECCPEHLIDELKKGQAKMTAFKKAFQIAKINFREHCFFDLVPHDFLVSFLETKNKITEHVYENYDEPKHYQHLVDVERLLYKIRYQQLNVNNQNCRNLFVSSQNRVGAQKILQGSKFIDYNIFGTRTGRLSTHPGSFPILTMKKDFRALVKPQNDWFVSLDYNGAEVRTTMSLLGIEQPSYDVHEWNMEHVLKDLGITERESAKTTFFGWLYNPNSNIIEGSIYDRNKILSEYYNSGMIDTPFGRKILVDKDKALNYIVQSTTADLVNDRAVQIDKLLIGKKSFVSHIVHDEVVIDVANDERDLIAEMKDLFSNNRLGFYKTNIKAGKDYFNLGDLNI
ncbi:MAG: hypothetical protein CMF52_03245 [Legionellales bacterium]|nr:hypothetical protein [Legionellales bacterium]